MAIRTQNSDLVPKEALQDLQNLNTQMDGTIQKMESLLQTVSKTAEGLSQVGLSAKVLAQFEKELQKTTEQTNATRDQRTAIEKKMEATLKRITDAESQQGREVADVTEYLRQRNAENRILAKETLAAANSIEQMRIRVSKLKTEKPQEVS